MSNHYTRMMNARKHRDWMRDYLYSHDWTAEQFAKIERDLVQAELDVERRL